jgi:nucleoside-diphosphate-sugar epimerase
MRILVTGSSGQLGAEVARQLLAAGHQVVGLDRARGPLTPIVASVTERAAVLDACRGVQGIVHTASLHAPHVLALPKQAFVDTNVSGALNLLEAACESGVQRFVYTSTTSVYGSAMVPRDRAVWVTESLPPQPRDIYDITKLAAESLCEHFARNHDLATTILRTSRFFEEPPESMATYRLYRGGDVRDMAAAHVRSLLDATHAFDVFNVSARSPFEPDDLEQLLVDAPAVVRRYFPEAEAAFASRGWSLPRSIDRVYVIAKAEERLGYAPRFNFAELLQTLGEGVAEEPPGPGSGR